ncbi:uncharacterized protein EKO05_0008871 [Ascochyta rabiei]|uniref:uncharacterized protein n=1 Tax=Didymella rabiei TaxID=5454 RepID=UPI0022050173|nr:uncharacterized protein EKO05_0008871 [Ascochyta rabiei]UPX18577.1 hypothetical protein EKO05_0008871 [Ascochyta rabiei]
MKFGRQTLSPVMWANILHGYTCTTRAPLPAWLSFALAVLFLATPVTALPDADARGVDYYAVVTAILLATHYIATMTGSLIGPSMGITSVLWLVMRNDAAVEAKLSWMVFGAWGLLMLLYLVIQRYPLLSHSLYILLTIAMASLCMCMVALVQQSSLQSGLVTAIPPCTSFAAYGVAYFFPEQRTTEPRWFHV